MIAFKVISVCAVHLSFVFDSSESQTRVERRVIGESQSATRIELDAYSSIQLTLRSLLIIRSKGSAVCCGFKLKLQ